MNARAVASPLWDGPIHAGCGQHGERPRLFHHAFKISWCGVVTRIHHRRHTGHDRGRGERRFRKHVDEVGVVFVDLVGVAVVHLPEEGLGGAVLVDEGVECQIGAFAHDQVPCRAARIVTRHGERWGQTTGQVQRDVVLTGQPCVFVLDGALEGEGLDGLTACDDEVVWRQGDVKLAISVVFPHQIFKPVLTQRRQGFGPCDDGGPLLVLAHVSVAVLDAWSGIHEHHVIPCLRGHTTVGSRGQFEHHWRGLREFRSHHAVDRRGDDQGERIARDRHVVSLDAGAPGIRGIGLVQIVVHVDAVEEELNFFVCAYGVRRGGEFAKCREFVDDHTQRGVGLTPRAVGQGECQVS